MKANGATSLYSLLLCGLVGVFVGVGCYTFYFAEGISYLSNDPVACVNCHIMREQYDGWQKASHHTVATCNDCHVPHGFISKYMVKAENGYMHSKAFTFGGFHEPIRMRDVSREVVQHNCIYCHSTMVGSIIKVGEQGEVIDCIRCHEDVGHGPPR